MSSDQIIVQTKQWINSFIIEYNICPFARRAFINKQIYFAVIESISIENCLYDVFVECQRLDNQKDIETTFLIFPDYFDHFDEFLNFLALSEELLKLHSYEGIYQLASFHPAYCFENTTKQDPENFTNKSPYPMLHLIREASVSKAISSFPHPELIPQNNIDLTRKLGTVKLQAILNTALNKQA